MFTAWLPVAQKTRGGIPGVPRVVPTKVKLAKATTILQSLQNMSRLLQDDRYLNMNNLEITREIGWQQEYDLQLQ